jgi:uncharacterized integral membrane protein
LIVVKVLLVVAFAACGATRAVSNPGSTHVGDLLGQVDMPAAWRVVGSVTAGALLGVTLAGAAVVRWRQRARRWQRKAEEARQERAHLRSLPYPGA